MTCYEKWNLFFQFIGMVGTIALSVFAYLGFRLASRELNLRSLEHSQNKEDRDRAEQARRNQNTESALTSRYFRITRGPKKPPERIT